jgi:type II secretory pathway pseudopilin PulG
MRTRTRQLLPPPRPAGFSLVEAVVAAGIVGLMLVASINLFGSAVRTRAVDNDRRTALMLANELISEIQQQAYKDENLGALLFGPELGEPGTTRANFDDVDDYDRFQEKPPKLKDGTTLVGYETWMRTVKVTWVRPADLSPALLDSGLVLIEVTVTDPKNRVTTVSALRSASMTADAPPAGTTALLWAGVELEAGGDTPRRATGGVNLVTQPPTP